MCQNSFIYILIQPATSDLASMCISPFISVDNMGVAYL